MKNSYCYDQDSIESLDEVDLSTPKIYRYKNVYFLYKPAANPRNLLVSFNGALRKEMAGSIVFRGYNYSIQDTSILCISDALLVRHPSLLLSWYLDFSGTSFNDTYLHLVLFFINSLATRQLVFTGTSGGGFPAVRYASIFNGIALISNSQIYPEKYPYWKSLCAYATNASLSIESYHLEALLSEKKPKSIICYQNTSDRHHYCKQFLPFLSFCMDSSIDIMPLSFNEEHDSHINLAAHSIIFPAGKSHQLLLSEILDGSIFSDQSFLLEPILSSDKLTIFCRYLKSDLEGCIEYRVKIRAEGFVIAESSWLPSNTVSIPIDTHLFPSINEIAVTARSPSCPDRLQEASRVFDSTLYTSD